MTDVAEAPGPLTPEQQQELSDARDRAKPVMRAARWARFNAWSMGIFAALTIIFGLFSFTAIVLGVGLAVVTWNEYRGGRMLMGFDPAAPRLLGRNQLGLMALIMAYALWSIYRARTHPDADLAQMDQILGGDTSGLVASLTTILYLAVMAATGLCQGFMARYYFKRGPMVEAYVRDTPAWVVDLQRATALD